MNQILATSGVCPVCRAKEGKICDTVLYQPYIKASWYEDNGLTQVLAGYHQARIDAAKKGEEE